MNDTKYNTVRGHLGLGLGWRWHQLIPGLGLRQCQLSPGLGWQRLLLSPGLSWRKCQPSPGLRNTNKRSGKKTPVQKSPLQ